MSALIKEASQALSHAKAEATQALSSAKEQAAQAMASASKNLAALAGGREAKADPAEVEAKAVPLLLHDDMPQRVDGVMLLLTSQLEAPDLVRILTGGQSQLLPKVIEMLESTELRVANAAAMLVRVLCQDPTAMEPYVSEPRFLPLLVRRLGDANEDVEMRKALAVALMYLAKNSSAALQIMIHNGIPCLLRALTPTAPSRDSLLQTHICGALAHMCFHAQVRPFLWQVITPANLAHLVQTTQSKTLLDENRFWAVMALAFMALNERSLPALRQAGALAAIDKYVHENRPQAMMSTAFSVTWDDLSHFVPLLLCDVPAVSTFATWALARYTTADERVNKPAYRDVICAELRGQTSALTLLRRRMIDQSEADSKAADWARDALLNIDDEWSQRHKDLATWLARLHVMEDPAKLSKEMRKNHMSIRVLATTPADLLFRGLSKQSWIKLGDVYRVVAGAEALQRDLSDDLVQTTSVPAGSRGAPTRVPIVVPPPSSVPTATVHELDDETESGGAEAAAALAMSRAPDIFLSYSWANKTETKSLKKALEAAGFYCWMDESQLVGGAQLYAEIDRGIRSCKVFLACLSDAYARSVNCQRELSLASDISAIIIPVWVAPLSSGWPPEGSLGPLLTGKLYLDLSTPEKYSSEVQQLLSAAQSIVRR